MIIHRWWMRWGVFAVILSLLSACCNANVTVPLPKTDIVFQAMVQANRPYVLGFVNGDGSMLEYVDINHFSGGMPVFPAWTSDSAFLTFQGAHVVRHAGHLFAITSTGQLIRYDEKLFYDASRVAPVKDSHQVVIRTSTGGLPEDRQSRIQLLDLDKQLVTQTYITTTEISLDVGTNALHNSSLVYIRGWLVNDEHRIQELVLLDIDTEEETVLAKKEGRLWAPAISPDGQWVAYTAEDGIYAMNVAGGEHRQLMETCVLRKRPDGYLADFWWPAPSWSPDSQWLIYHRCVKPCSEECGADVGDYSIFKVNVNTGEELLLVEGGLNPYWRQDLAR